MADLKLKCCVPSCEALADYEIREVLPKPIDPIDYTHSCLAHVSDLLTDAIVHEVVKLKSPGDPTPVYR